MKRKSLSFKLIAGGLTAVFIPILVIGVFSAWKSSATLEDEARLRSVEIVKGLGNMTSMVLQEKMKITSDLASRKNVIEAAAKASGGAATAPAAAPGPSDGKSEPPPSAPSAPQGYSELAADLEGITKSTKEYENIYVADAKGVLFVDSVGGKSVGINVTDRDYFKGAAAGKVSFGAPAKSKLTGNPTFSIAAPVRSASGEFVGIVGMIINLDFLSERIAATKIGETGYAYLLDSEGLCIAHPKKDFVLVKNPLKDEGMKEIGAKMTARKTGADFYSFQGVKKIGGYAPISETGWILAAVQNFDELMAPARMIRNLIFAMGLLFLAITAVAVFFYAKKISQPITRAVGNLNDGALQISGAAGQVSGSSQMLAEGASEASASIEETSSSLEELSSMTRKNAENANYSRSLMAEAKQIVEKVNRSMNEMTAAISEVTKSSEETGKIIRTIDEIAFQTNLLALNAAVEAARAGEAGAGFAVVADEVRNLAMRAAEAARSTSSLIENTITGIRNSNELTAATQKGFQETIEITGKIGTLIDEIAAASDEQARGIEQINTAITEMDKLTQRNAATAEESASASEEMSSQADQLKHIAFELSDVVGNEGSGTAPDEEPKAAVPALTHKS